jgi:hypothetical protein
MKTLSKRSVQWFSVALGLVVLARVASAQEAPSGEPAAQLSLDVGFASAVGEMGAALALFPSWARWLELEVGAGWGATGVSLSFMPKYVLRTSERNRFTTGVGIAVSLGSEASEGSHLFLASPGAIGWVNVDAFGLEHRLGDRFVLSFAGGVAIGLNGNYCIADCHPNDLVSDPKSLAGAIVPQARVGIGFLF